VAGLLYLTGLGVPVEYPISGRPIPEFAPTEKIVLPIGLFQFNYHADKLVSEIIKAGAAVEVVGQKTLAEEGDTPTHQATISIDHTNIWLREFAPIPFKNKSKVHFLGIDSGSPDFENAAFGRNLSDHLNLDFQETQAAIEGGNFLTDGTNCYMSGSIDNDKEYSSDNERVIKQSLGCKKLITIEKPPHVHIDMYAKILNSKTVLVNELTSLSLDLVKDNVDDIPADILELKNSLNAAAKQFSKHLHVVRIPMPVPFKNTFRTYTNSILVNGTAIVPDYKNYREVGGPYPDDKILPKLRAKATAIYHRFGYEVRYVNADSLIYNGGAFHCVTMHLPKQSLTTSTKGRNRGGTL